MHKLDSKIWDKMILQENGQHAFENPREALASFNTYKAYFEGKPTQVYIFMTWAYEGHPEMTGALDSLYTQAAMENGLTKLPVGLGWRDVMATNPPFELLSADGVHPSMHGTYFSAAMLFEMISGQVVTNNPYTTPLNEEDAEVLKEFAHQAVLEHFN
ncbi:hypothetical protein C8D94_102267 [Marinirhabdus gelatinilytica]|uniref:GDSL-like lipase/acylhydrolase family protein n=2 Tax=Marinirhabdus gelatinilytica TaxID=1703343 RepID=A0A370QFE9_9FLAO|nr:hypothetical protein C8D94_102267 [Marinirhabdus gelatinilytica]